MNMTMLVGIGLAALLCAFGPAGAKGKAAQRTKADLVGGLTPAGLSCESADDPLGVDSLAPRLSWGLRATDPAARGLRQTAYRVLAASSPALLARGRADLWDSGHTATDQARQVPYGGRPLHAAEQVFWKVQVWDQNGRPSAWSRAGRWTMGCSSPPTGGARNGSARRPPPRVRTARA